MDENRLREALNLFYKEEMDVILNAIETNEKDVSEVIIRLAMARYRAVQRAQSDAQTDARRRVLVGARVPRALYRRVKACASARGVSMYRLMVDEIEQMCDYIEGQTVEGGERDKAD